MNVSTKWQNTVQGPAFYIEAEGRIVAFPEAELGDKTTADRAAISLWEGIAGRPPVGFWSRRSWRRGLRRIHKAIMQAIAERAAYSGLSM